MASAWQSEYAGTGGVASIYDDFFTLKCESDYFVVGMQDGEVPGTIVRVISTLVTVSIASAWCDKRKVKRLLLFFSHWLSGLLHQVAGMLIATLVSICWINTEAEVVIKFLKFLELAGSNMLAVTNLGICVNLALVVSSHRTMSRVKSVSSPSLILFFAFISAGATAASVPFWDETAISGTLIWMASPRNETRQDWVTISQFFLEFAVGVCLLVIVTLLLIFRFKEVKECWKIHRRIRFYFGLTLIATVLNLSLGICGTLYVIWNRHWQLLISIGWTCRHVHIALDALVLYGVLGVSSRSMDERASEAKSSDAVLGNGSHSDMNGTNGGSKRAVFANGNAHRKVHSSHSSTTFTATLSRL